MLDFATLLATLRESRGFVAEEVLASKIARLALYFSTNQIDSAVVGLSGGVDSAVTLGLLATTQAKHPNILRRIIALLLPIEGPGATRQTEATVRGRLVAAAFGVEAWESPLGEAQRACVAALERGSTLSFDAWAEGQLLSVLRTPALYGSAALLQSQGFRSLVVGTTNRDEGAYLGFWGKASDGMVDLQPIADLHKSEVYALARLLGVPQEVIDAPPSGDVFDGRSDAEMIGASYDQVEAILRLKELGLALQALPLQEEACIHLQHAETAIEALHRHNAHKYRVGSPAVMLDVLPRGVPGGWQETAFAGRDEQRPAKGILPGEWEPPPLSLSAPEWPQISHREGAILAEGVLSPKDCAQLIAAMETHATPEPVGVTGLRDSYGIGSIRATAWAPALAAELWKKLRVAVPSVRFTDEFADTDAFATATRKAHRSWRVVGVGPVLRFMRYETGGHHLSHHDAGFDYGDGRRSLMSVVWYLRADGTGGATRLIEDKQRHLPAALRKYDDWEREAQEDEVLAAFSPTVGSAILFDHRRCHDVQRWEGPGSRIILRGDIVFEAVPDGRLP